MFLLTLLSVVSLGASAQTRAWLDRDRIAFGETVTLNIETEDGGRPDYAALQPDFEISGRSSRSQFELSSSGSSRKTLYAVALRPLREGVLTVPALQVGAVSTEPLSLVVTPGSTVAPTRAGDDVFIESEADDTQPYVQQTVGWVVRLYSAVPLISGQLDQPAPDGAALQRIGDDAQYTRSIDGRRYNVIERRYQLIPERSGSVTMPAARFEGRAAAGFFDDFFGNRSGVLKATAAQRFLQVRPIPDGAPQPWLPLHNLQLRYQSSPQELRVGSAATLTIEAVADGATAAQMPDLALPSIDGVQVFADPVQVDETFVEGRPRVKLTRKFSLVPSAGGEVRLPGMELNWWDVRKDKASTASLPALTWQVTGAPAAQSGGAGLPSMSGTAPPSVDTPVADNAAVLAPAQPANRAWIVVATAFALLWLLTLAWALQQRSLRAATPAALAGSASTKVRPAAAHPAVLKRALATGDLGEVADALCASARPPARDIEEALDRLDDPMQRDAVTAMQRARWSDGDGVDARSRLRAAFKQGPRWREPAAVEKSPLPPLYPQP